MECEIEVNWLINYFCNFNCIYCYPGLINNQFTGLTDIEKIVNGFNRTGATWLIYISGGEPFLFPNFVKLCEELTKKHTISINTNLSHKDVFRFAESINPEKVRCVHCSLHIREQEKRGLVKEFIKKYHFLKKRGFYTYASYVIYPHFLNRFIKDYNYFKSEGVILRPKVFRGDCNRFRIFDLEIFRKKIKLFKKNYPKGYTEGQKKLIISYIEQSQDEGKFNINHDDDEQRGRLSDVYLDKLFINGFPSFKGRYCMAGKTFVRMTPAGEVYRCYNHNQYLGNLFEGKINLFDKPAKCEAKLCTCPYMGFGHVLREGMEPDKNGNFEQDISDVNKLNEKNFIKNA